MILVTGATGRVGYHLMEALADIGADATAMVRVEAKGAGLPVSYLAPAMYMENLLAAAQTIRGEGMLYAPAGQGRAGFIAASDVAAVAARVLTSGGRHRAGWASGWLLAGDSCSSIILAATAASHRLIPPSGRHSGHSMAAMAEQATADGRLPVPARIFAVTGGPWDAGGSVLNREAA
ncbi:MAG TPA: hypothetical protein VMV92_30880 [Streptosporangiaceae bacterium]|nr:hypothetical protein [Streptosporangiaceae bacterium]